LHPRRGPALPQETGLVDHEYAEVFDDVSTQVVADGVVVPAGVRQQTLHRPGWAWPASSTSCQQFFCSTLDSTV
jgi:hypothetical protein